METGIEDIEGLVCDLNIADDAPQDCGQEPLRSTCSHPVSLQNAIHMLIQSTKTITFYQQIEVIELGVKDVRGITGTIYGIWKIKQRNHNLLQGLS